MHCPCVRESRRARLERLAHDAQKLARPPGLGKDVQDVAAFLRLAVQAPRVAGAEDGRETGNAAAHPCKGGAPAHPRHHFVDQRQAHDIPVRLEELHRVLAVARREHLVPFAGENLHGQRAQAFVILRQEDGLPGFHPLHRRAMREGRHFL